MFDFGLQDFDLKIICEVLRRYPDIEEALIFGSRAMGNYKPGSDIDIALKGQLSEETLNHVFRELNERAPLPYKFDVVDYSTLVNQPLVDHIDRHGKRLYVAH